MLMQVIRFFLGCFCLLWAGCLLIFRPGEPEDVVRRSQEQLRSLQVLEQKYKVKPGQVTALHFPYLGPFDSERLTCNNKGIPYFVDAEKKLAHAYLSRSYFDESKEFSCQFSFAVKGRVFQQSVGMIEPQGYSYPEEHLTVDQKKVKLSKVDRDRVREESIMLSKIYDSSQDRPLYKRAFKSPLNSVVTSFYGVKRVFNKEVKGQHLGLDYRAKPGTEITAANDGLVVFVGDLFFAGLTVIVDHGQGLFTTYSHLSKALVKVGDEVSTSSKLGLSGMSGRVNGPHLHWGVKLHGHWVCGNSLIEASQALFPSEGLAEL